MDDNEFDKLPLEERCAHKNWKARLSGYSSIVKLLRNVDDDLSSECQKYVHIIKNIVSDVNDPALEKGLEVILIFLEKLPFDAGKTVTHVMPHLVKRCIASNRPTTRALSNDICLKYTEVGKQDVVLAELLKGTDLKTPKIVSACTVVISQVVKEFGAEIFEVKSLIGKVVALLEDRDVNVRNSSKGLMVELYRWLGPALKPHMDQLKPSKLNEVMTDIAKIQDLSPVPTRFLRSQQIHQTAQIEGPPSLHPSDLNSSLSRDRVDPSNALQPVTVLSVPSEFLTQIQSRKWSERRDALESLEKTLSQMKRIKSGDFLELIKVLTNVISKDTNIAVVSLAIKCITFLAIGLRADLGSHVSTIFTIILEKLKEKKNTIVCLLRDAMDALLGCSTLDSLSADLIDGLKNKNPNVRSETALFLSRCFCLLPAMELNKKGVKPLIVSLTTTINDQDPTVRNSSASALGIAVRIIGEKKLAPMLENIDHNKMIKIKEHTSSAEMGKMLNQSVVDEHEKRKNVSLSSRGPCKRVPSVRTDHKKALKKCEIKSHESQTIVNEHNKISTPGSTREDKNSNQHTANHVPSAIIVGLAHEHWAKRLQAVSDLKQYIRNIQQLPININEITELLSRRILDNNPKIATTSIALIIALAEKLKQEFKGHIPIVLPSVLKCIADSKIWVSQPAFECLGFLSKHCGYTEIIKNGSLADILKSGSQTARVRLWHWLSENLNNITLNEIPSEELGVFLPPLFISLEDRNQEVRKSASMAVGRFIKLLGRDVVLSKCECYFKGQNNPLTKLLKEESEEFRLEPQGDKAEVNSSSNFNSAREANIVTTKPSFEYDDRSPLLDINNLKHQRVIDEHKNKMIKWDFSYPRAEFVELLKSLMFAAKFSQPLMNNMFHDNFKNQLAAMDMLLDELQQNYQAIVSNLDLILRWLTLRFFDACPIVLGKGLDFLNVTLDILKRTNYCFLDSEASILVPYIILKMADPRDNIQMKVKEILFKLSSLYPVNKLRKFVMEGLRTKSVKQKVNCLDVLKYFIDMFGETVYTKDLDIIAEQIVKLFKDRDSEVKKCAFSVAASLFSREGEKMLKFIEKYAGRDDPTIEQRVRKIATATAARNAILPQHTMPLVGNDTGTHSHFVASTNETLEHNKRENVITMNTNGQILLRKEKTSDKFKLDWELLKDIESSVNVPIRSPNLVKVDLEFLRDENKDSTFISYERCKIFNSSLNTPERGINDIVNDDLISSIRAVKKIDELLNSKIDDFSVDFIDSVVHQIAQQLCKLAQINNRDNLRCYGTIFTLLITLCSTKRYVHTISRSNLLLLIEQLLLLISNNIFDIEEDENYRAVVNEIILKILVNGRKTDLLSGLLEMMGRSRGSTQISGKINELYMKCLWKLTRNHPSWDAELDYSEIFKSMRTIIKTYDFPWWTCKVNDNSLRTMKTILRSMVKLRGESILTDAKMSSSPVDGFEIYVKKLLHSMRCKKEGELNIKDLPKQNFSIQHARELSDIFKTVATNPSEGMERLCKFKEVHPDIDLHRIISKVSPELYKYFLWFNGQRNAIQGTASEIDFDTTDSETVMSRDEFSEEVGRIWNRLKILQERVKSA